MNTVKESAKALLAAAIAGVGALSAVLVGPTEISSVTDGQWVAVALATLVALGGVWGIKNKPPS